MTKVLLVEDDNNLREIFEMRLQAEGYNTVTAGDGEEGLVVAMREKPDLIIADVMMPKLSGFEMVESLKSAPETSNIKVIMMTALGQAEDQARGQKLAVVKYLVKSQVTLEDFVRVVRDALKPDSDGTGASTSTDNNNQESENKMPEDNTTPTNPVTPPAGDDSGTPSNPISGAPAPGDMGDTGQMSSAQQQSGVNDQVNDFVASTPATPAAGDTSGTVPAPSGDGMPAPDSPVGGPMDPSAPATPAADPTVPPAAGETPPSSNPGDSSSSTPL